MTSETSPCDGAAAVRKARRKRWSVRRKQRFLDKLAETLNVSEAARAAQMDRTGAYALKSRDPAFAKGWREALDQAYVELEVVLLKQSRDGSVRTETVLDKETGEVRQTKTVHSYPLAVASRLLLSHKDEVSAHRAALAVTQAEDDVIARVRAHMDEVRERLRPDEKPVSEEETSGRSSVDEV